MDEQPRWAEIHCAPGIVAQAELVKVTIAGPPTPTPAGAATKDQAGSAPPIGAALLPVVRFRVACPQVGVMVGLVDGVTVGVVVFVLVADGLGENVGEGGRVGVMVGVLVVEAVRVGVAVAVTVGGLGRHGTRRICPFKEPLRSIPVGVCVPESKSFCTSMRRLW